MPMSNYAKALYRRHFLKCKTPDCGFMLTTLAQADRIIETCPVCNEMNMDYAPEKAREEYVKDLRQELEAMAQYEGGVKSEDVH